MKKQEAEARALEAALAEMSATNEEIAQQARTCEVTAGQAKGEGGWGERPEGERKPDGT